jgi:hypothetical protein
LVVDGSPWALLFGEFQALCDLQQRQTLDCSGCIFSSSIVRDADFASGG